MFTDFGLAGPYLGQMEAVLIRQAPGIPIINLFADVPRFEPRLAAYLLAAYVAEFPRASVFLCVVDPGVGTDQRLPVVVREDSKWFVGPHNGLFHRVLQQAGEVQCWRIDWRPGYLSESFHGRDLFAPVAARLARGEIPAELTELGLPEFPDAQWPEDLPVVIYIDGFGNCMTGIQGGNLRDDVLLEVAGTQLAYARTFGLAAAGSAFWYRNANGLVELAVNSGSCQRKLGVSIHSEIRLQGKVAARD